EQEDHEDPVQAEQLVICLGRDQVAGRRQQLEANDGGEDAAEKKEEADGAEIQQRDAFMVLGEKPALDAVFMSQVVIASRCNCRNHTNYRFCFRPTRAAGGAACCCGLARLLMYSINCSKRSEER